jgi:50S ribosome-binding GTPase
MHKVVLSSHAKSRNLCRNRVLYQVPADGYIRWNGVRFVSVKSYINEGRAIARALEYMKNLSPRVTVHMEKIQLVGCRLLPPAAERVITNSTVRIRCLTHADFISDDALRHQIAVAEEQEQQRYHGTYRPSDFFPTAIIALNLKNVTKTKQLRPVQLAIFGAAHVARHKQILVCGVPNSGKSSLILPLTKQRTMEVRNKKAFHLPKVSDRAGMTIAVKKHVMEANTHGEVTLIDTPGLRPRLEGRS